MLKAFTIESIYKVGDQRVNLPTRMAKLVDTAVESLTELQNDIRPVGGKIILSDAFRSKEDQEKARNDYVTGKKKAFSPPAGHSYHEAGRAIDLDLSSLAIPLSVFWSKARNRGWSPVIPQPVSTMSEAWHFEYREYWQTVPSYNIGKRCAVLETYKALSLPMSEKDEFMLRQGLMWLLGYYKGAIDGSWGPISKSAETLLKDKTGVVFKDKYAEELRRLILARP